MKEKSYEGKIYNFSNENLVDYKKVYDFNNAKILSVIGSGDYYFSSVLYGASDIELYDVNKRSWDYFILKYYSILILSYEEFYNFFVTSNLDNIDIYNKVRYYLPDIVKYNLDKFIRESKSLSSMMLKNTIYNLNIDNLDRVIPYFEINNYYELKDKLFNYNLPKVYFDNLMDLHYCLEDNKRYDLMITSNIYRYLGLSVSEYKELLNRFNIDTIQANYCWLHEPKENFIEHGFYLSEIDSVFKNRKDYILTLENKNNNILTLKK